MKIIKHSGNVVEFNREKLRASLSKSGASDIVVQEVIAQIESQMFDGISTRQIYKQAFGLLKKRSNSHAARYNLRQGLQQLGPAGFFFEKFMARIFAADGFETRTNLILAGRCVSHEVDVVRLKDGKCDMVECKFHSRTQSVSDVKVPMYILSRFNDLKEIKHRIFTDADLFENCLIVSNNRFTSDAVTFALCSGLQILSWDYPAPNDLKGMIDRHSLYPVTCLTTLSLVEKEKLLIMDVIFARDLVSKSDALEHIGLSPTRIKNVLKETSGLCNII